MKSGHLMVIYSLILAAVDRIKQVADDDASAEVMRIIQHLNAAGEELLKLIRKSYGV